MYNTIAEWAGEHAVLCTNILLLVIPFVLLVVLFYHKHREEILELEESVIKLEVEKLGIKTGIFHKRWGVLGRIAAIRAYTALRNAKMERYNSLAYFIKKRVEEDPNGRGWEARVPIRPTWLLDFALDYRADCFEKMRQKEMLREDSGIKDGHFKA